MNERIIKCPICGASVAESYYSQHKKSNSCKIVPSLKEIEEKDQLVTCPRPNCNIKVKHKNLKKHLKRIHSIKEKISKKNTKPKNKVNGWAIGKPRERKTTDISNEAKDAWKHFVEYSIGSKFQKQLRLASKFKQSDPWVNGVASPTLPTQMESSVELYRGWANPESLKYAKTIVKNKKMTLRELQQMMLIGLIKDNLSMPYIWWVDATTSCRRVVHEDGEGRTFVKLDNKWQMAYSVQAIGGLVGSQYTGNHEEVPKNTYFVLWENEQIARKYSF